MKVDMGFLEIATERRDLCKEGLWMQAGQVSGAVARLPEEDEAGHEGVLKNKPVSGRGKGT